MAEAPSTIEVINSEINRELSNQNVKAALIATTFKGLNEISMKQAIMEGMVRGFTFKDFLEKNIYAIPFSNGYSLVTSIDYARKIGMRSGIVGKLAPIFEEKEGLIIACEVTVKRKVDGYVGDFTAKVYFGEYDKGINLWNTKPRTMIAKVAEMHALRMACPEVLSQSYIEEEVGENDGRKKRAEAESEGLTMESLKKTHEDKKTKEDKNKAEEKPDAPSDKREPDGIPR